MAEPRQNDFGRPEPHVPIAHVVNQVGAGAYDDDVPVAVGERVPAPAVIVAATLPPTAPSLQVAEARPASVASPIREISQTGTWAVPGCGTSSYGDTRAGNPADGPSAPSMTQTGTWTFPGTGTRNYGVHGPRTRSGAESASAKKDGVPGRDAFGGMLRIAEEDHVDESAAVLFACGQGESMYDVKGNLSSWVLLSSEKREKGGSERGGGSVEKDTALVAETSARGVWALRSQGTAAGEGGVMCSACLPSSPESSSAGQRFPRTLLTGGKDCVLREWRVTDGRARLIAEIPGHSDWISCCALVPPDSAGLAPTTAVSGGRDGSVRIWSRSKAAAAESGQDSYPIDQSAIKSGGYFCASGGGKSGGGQGGRSMGTGNVLGRMGAWSLASLMPEAHGTSEFVSCCAGPGAAAGASGGWVATGGTDWSVRLWDVVKSRELGRLSFMGHSHPVRSVAVSPDGNLLVSGGEDHKVIVWSPKSRRSVAKLTGHVSTVNGVAVDEGTQPGQPPRWVASGGGDGNLFVWDPRNWKAPVTTLRGVDYSEQEISLRESGARSGARSGKWEGEAAGASMLNSVTCLAGGAGGEWLFAAGETVVRAWHRKDGMWVGGKELPGDGLGGVASLTVVI